MKPDTEQTYRHRILRVLLYIQEHLDDDLSLEELARVAHFSMFHFHRVFKAIVGQPVREYVRRLRLERAAIDLKQGEGSIAELALEAGYETHEAFTRAFKGMFGVAPSVFRSDHQATLGNVLEPLKERYAVISEVDAESVRIENFKERRVVMRRYVGPYNEVGPTYSEFMMWAGMAGLMGPEAMALGISYDDPDVTPADQLRYDCALVIGEEDTVDEAELARGQARLGHIPAGRYAVVTHHGPYEGLGEVYRWMFGRWLPTSGQELGDVPCFDVYLNSIEDCDSEDLLTDVCIPLKS